MRERDRLSSYVQGRAFTRIKYDEVSPEDIAMLYQVAARHLLGREFTTREAQDMQKALKDSRGRVDYSTPIPFRGSFSPPFFIHEFGPVDGKDVKITSCTGESAPRDNTADVILFGASVK